METEPEEPIPPPPAPPRTCRPETGGQSGVYTNLVDVRVGTHGDYDRITFEFRAPKPNPGGKSGIPLYEIRSARPPFTHDGSGEPLAVSGNAFVNLVFHGATGVDLEYEPTYHGPAVLRPGFDNAPRGGAQRRLRGHARLGARARASDVLRTRSSCATPTGWSSTFRARRAASYPSSRARSARGRAAAT